MTIKWELLDGPNLKLRDPAYGEVCKIIRIDSHGFIALFGYPMNMYNSARFRPVATRRTDISVFMELMNKTSVDA